MGRHLLLFQSDKPEELTRIESLLGVVEDEPPTAATGGPCGALERLADTAANRVEGVVSNGVVSGAKEGGQKSSKMEKAEANGRWYNG